MPSELDYMPVLCGFHDSGFFWFRIFGFGLHGKRYKGNHPIIHPLLFSEREEYSKILKIGNWCFGLLIPNDWRK